MTITEQIITAPIRGIERPVTVCHITDSHVSLCDGRDDERLNDHARERDGMFSNGHEGALEKALFGMADRARDADAVIFTGDIIDFPSKANIDLMRRMFAASSSPCLYCFGNHDYSVPWQSRAEALDNQKMPDLLAALPNDPTCARLDVGGIRFVGVDNSLYQFSPAQVEALRADLSAGMPVVLCMHIPLYSPTLYEPTLNFWRTPCLTGVPEALLPPGAADGGDLPMTEVTRAGMELLAQSRNLAAVLAGHIHFTHDDEIFPGVRQYSCANGAMGFMRRIRFVPEGAERSGYVV